MKTKLIIEEGITQIILTHENMFEYDMLKKLFENQNEYDPKLSYITDLVKIGHRDYSIKILIENL